MAKSFKKFRDEWDDDEWGDRDLDSSRKEARLQNRRNKRKLKAQEKYSAIDDVEETRER